MTESVAILYHIQSGPYIQKCLEICVPSWPFLPPRPVQYSPYRLWPVTSGRRFPSLSTQHTSSNVFWLSCTTVPRYPHTVHTDFQNFSILYTDNCIHIPVAPCFKITFLLWTERPIYDHLHLYLNQFFENHCARVALSTPHTFLQETGFLCEPLFASHLFVFG